MSSTLVAVLLGILLIVIVAGVQWMATRGYLAALEERGQEPEDSEEADSVRGAG
jgi:hypothetical protein